MRQFCLLILPTRSAGKKRWELLSESQEKNDSGDELVAIMDIITGYPESDDAFIGWFIVNGENQGQGIGSQIFADVRASLKGQCYDYISLGCVKENTAAVSFWEAQGFKTTGEEKPSGKHTVLTFERSI